MSKKVITCLMLVGILLTVALPSTAKTSSNEVVKKHLLVEASVPGGIGYSFMMGMAKVAEKVVPEVILTLEATNGYKDNAIRMARGVGDLGILGASDAYAIIEGKKPYENPATKTLCLFPVHTQDWHIIVPARSDINSIFDLEGKIVNLQPKGGLAQSMSEEILEVLGIKYKPLYLPHDEAADAMRVGTIDAHIVGGSSVPFRELAERFNIRLINLEDEVVEKITKELPYLKRTKFKGELFYSGTSEIQTVTMWALCVAREDIPEGIVYKLVKGVYENLDIMINAHPAAQFMNPNDVIDAGVTVHPGAIKYYDEIGVRIPLSLRL